MVIIYYPDSIKKMVNSLVEAKELLRRDVPSVVFTELQPWEVLATLPASTSPSRHLATIFLDNSKRENLSKPFDGGLPTQKAVGCGSAEPALGTFEYSAKSKDLSAENRLITLLQALAETYPNDLRCPGVITSWLGDERGWYCAIHRFPRPEGYDRRLKEGKVNPNFRGERTVLVKVDGKYSLSETYREAAKKWLVQIGCGASTEVLKSM